jgi:hypothetical protein
LYLGERVESIWKRGEQLVSVADGIVGGGELFTLKHLRALLFGGRVVSAKVKAAHATRFQGAEHSALQEKLGSYSHRKYAEADRARIRREQEKWLESTIDGRKKMLGALMASMPSYSCELPVQRGGETVFVRGTLHVAELCRNEALESSMAGRRDYDSVLSSVITASSIIKTMSSWRSCFEVDGRRETVVFTGLDKDPRCVAIRGDVASVIRHNAHTWASTVFDSENGK